MNSPARTKEFNIDIDPEPQLLSDDYYNEIFETYNENNNE